MKSSEAIKEQIRKLLALTASPNVNEASLAMKRAKELMIKYCIEADQLNPAEVEIIEKEYSPTFLAKGGLGLFNKFPSIAEQISFQFGCHILICHYGSNNPFKIVGFPTNIEMSEYAIDAIINQCLIDYRRGYLQNRSLTFSDAFWTGVLRGLHEKFEKPNEVGLVIYDRIKDYMSKFGAVSIPSSFQGNTNAVELGQRSGKEAQIYKGVTTSKGNLLQ